MEQETIPVVGVGRRPGLPLFYKRVIEGEVLRTAALFHKPAGASVVHKKPSGTAAQKRGVQYENKVSTYLGLNYDYINNVEFEFDTSAKRFQRIIPDGLIFNNVELCLIVEIKTFHSVDAYHQLQQYKKVVTKWWPGEVATVEICGDYTTGVRLPVGVNLLEDPAGLLGINRSLHNVCILSNRRLKVLGVEDGRRRKK